jgi:3-oxoacyl-[acyl-carrier protein] reductase
VKTVLITGGASGIGLATARRMALTMRVIIVDRDGARAARAAQELQDSGASAFAYTADVTKSDEITAMMAQAAREAGPIHAMFCNAGVSMKQPVHKISEADWDLMIKTHVKGVFLCTRAVLPQMCERREGVIVTTGSDYSVRGKTDGAAYAAAKTAIYSLTKSLALEFAPFNIRCNSVGPGPIETPMLRAGRTEEEWAPIRTARAAQVPMGRLGQPEEVASVMDFLLSDRSSYITGQIIHPNGAQISW